MGGADRIDRIDRFPPATRRDATSDVSVSRRIKMHTYLLATLERDAVVGAATATVLKEAMADMMCTRSRCVGSRRAGERSVLGVASRRVAFFLLIMRSALAYCRFFGTVCVFWYMVGSDMWVVVDMCMGK